jgi:alkyl hydroperoxide reductase subunit F
MNVPGEREYRGRGVAYCPHCDGPLFKGKRVAVIGGGTSGVEAAIDLINLVTAERLEPAREPGGLHTVHFAGGGALPASSLILATGARWRNHGVPGEAEYRNKGVAYCPHCDGPLFKGKRIAVIGGGNSGVEAAIDLAKIVEHVTVI